MGLNRSFMIFPNTYYHCTFDIRLFEAYEEENYTIPDCSGVDKLLHFMEEHSLNESDLRDTTL